MINNRQNGRRRGRTGGAPRPNGGGGTPDRGSRLDNRARGNASQLHEKYKTLAGDAQRQGDRVMTEYYLQFADHYFRVLSETRSRFDEQQQRRERFEGQGDGQSEEDEEIDGEMNADDRFDDRSSDRPQRPPQEWGQERGHEGSRVDGNRSQGNRSDGYRGDGNRADGNRADGNRAEGNRSDGNRVEADRGDGNGERQERGDERDYRQPREPRDQREPREQRPPREAREQRPPRVRRGFDERRESGAERDQPQMPSMAPREDRAEPVADVPAPPIPAVAAELPLDAPIQAERRPRGRPRKVAAPADAPPSERIDVSSLPPAFSTEAAAPAADAGEDKPRRRTRRPRGESAAVEV